MTNADNVRVGRTGAIYRAPLGSTLPTSIADDVVASAPYEDLGYLSSDGIDQDEDFDITSITAWQNSDVVRNKVKNTYTFGFTAIETSPAVLKTRWRSDLVSDGAGGVKVEIGSNGDDRAVYVFDILDEDDTPFVRIVGADGQLTDADTITYNDGDDPVAYAMTMTFRRPSDGGQILVPYYSAAAIGFSG